MSFASPIWLTALLSWAGLVLYLLLGRRLRAHVPFLDLWRGPIKPPRVQRAVNRLPIWIALLLIAIATAILAAAGLRIAATTADSLAPSRENTNVGIESMVVRKNQVMVRVLNETAKAHTELWLKTGSTKSFYPIDLPAAGTSANYFFDLPSGVVNVGASLSAADGRHPGGSIDLVRQRSWPTVQAMSPLPAEVQRMLGVYANHRPSSETSARVGVVTGDATTLGGGAGVVLTDSPTTVAAGTPTVAAHPVTAEVTWSQVLADARFAANPPVDWTAVVSIAGRPVVAVREQPRQVWIGFDSASFARSPGFVIFWTNVLDWVGQGGDTFQPVPGTVFASRVQQTVQTPPKPQYDLSSWLACVAVGLSAVALAVAPKRVP